MFLATIDASWDYDDIPSGFFPFIRLKSSTKKDALTELELIIFKLPPQTIVSEITIFEVLNEENVEIFPSSIEKRRNYIERKNKTYFHSSVVAILANYHRIKERIESGTVTEYVPGDISPLGVYFATPGYYESREGIEAVLPQDEMAKSLYHEYTKNMSAIDAAILATEILLKSLGSKS